MSMIEVKNVTKRYGDKTVVDDLNFEVNEGEIFGFIGPSGSGKTTTIRLLTGVIRPTEGQVRLMGRTRRTRLRRCARRLVTCHSFSFCTQI